MTFSRPFKIILWVFASLWLGTGVYSFFFIDRTMGGVLIFVLLFMLGIVGLAVAMIWVLERIPAFSHITYTLDADLNKKVEIGSWFARTFPTWEDKKKLLILVSGPLIAIVFVVIANNADYWIFSALFFLSGCLLFGALSGMIYDLAIAVKRLSAKATDIASKKRISKTWTYLARVVCINGIIAWLHLFAQPNVESMERFLKLLGLTALGVLSMAASQAGQVVLFGLCVTFRIVLDLASSRGGGSGKGGSGGFGGGGGGSSGGGGASGKW